MKIYKLLFSAILIYSNIAAQFTVVSTKIVDGANPNTFTSFLTPATTGVSNDFPSIGNVLNAQEQINDIRMRNGAFVKVIASVSPLDQGDVLTGKLNLFTSFRDNSPENCQAQHHIQMLYEIRNDGGVSEDLFYALNPNIRFLKNGSFSSSSGYYRIQLRESNSSGTSGALIYNSGDMTGNFVGQPRGTAYSNVPAGATRYVILELWIAAYSENALGTIFIVDASQGIAVGFDNAEIPIAHNLNNSPVIDTEAKLKVQAHNIIASDANGPVMGLTGVNAYNDIGWDNNLSSAYGIEENTILLNGVGGITATISNLQLFDLNVIGNYGNQRDRRIYINGLVRIYQNDALKLELTNCRFGLNVSYPADVGEGFSTVGGGWGIINQANSDQDWIDEFDTFGNGQIEFVFESYDAVVDNPFFDAVISLVPRDYYEKIIGWDVADGGGNFDYLAEYRCSINFTSASQPVKVSQLQANAGRAVINLVNSDPGGAAPVGIENISPSVYWEIGTTLSSFNANVTFDLSGVPGISNINNIRILHRDDAYEAWTILDPGNYTINGNQITVAGITDFSQFGVGSTSGNLLPVELVSFNAETYNGTIKLNWQTATEFNNYGFEIERAASTEPRQENSNIEKNWQTIGFVNGSGNSNSPANYDFVDRNISSTSNLVEYRLKQIDTDGSFEYSNVLSVNLDNPANFELQQNYPNPFNPSTIIRYSIPSAEAQQNVSLKVFDVLGNQIATLVNENQSAGKYEVTFNASEFSSGIYFYRLSFGNITSIKKMTLIK